MTLTDRPVPVGATAGELRERHWLAGEASDLGLGASWLRLEGIDDDVDQAITAVRRELRAGDVSPEV